MGGKGSGRIWYGGAGGCGGKDATEDHIRIDIRRLKEWGCLKPGINGILSWATKWNGKTKEVGSINYRVEARRIILTYGCRTNGGEWQHVKQIVEFDQTRCHYGGFRKWFLCPKCDRRVAVLYGVGIAFFCRHCQGLCYTSQQGTEIDRLMQKAKKIRDRLGASHDPFTPIWERPKGMNKKTFDRLRDQDTETNMSILSHCPV